MNIAEFKAWFEGYTEDMEGPPSAAQWERIKSRVGELSLPPVISKPPERAWINQVPYNVLLGKESA